MATEMQAERHNVNPDLMMLLTPVADLHPDPQNARAHDAKDLDAIAASYARHGQQKPLVAMADGTVIAGNGQLLAARKLGWTHVAVVRFTDVKGKLAYALADNRTAELSSWDEGVLAAQLQELAAAGDDLIGTGFTSADIERMVGGPEAPPPDDDGEGGGGMDPGNTNHARLVQVFLTEQDYEPFQRAVRALAVRFDVDSLSAVVLRAVLAAHGEQGMSSTGYAAAT